MGRLVQFVTLQLKQANAASQYLDVLLSAFFQARQAAIIEAYCVPIKHV